jgi:hypothetical protein
MSSNIQKYQPEEITESVGKLSEGLSNYLNWLGLPTELVLVEIDERRLVIEIVPMVLEKLNPNKRQSSMYISKFIAACCAGLFDAALNYLWDETIRNLREKVARFDLNYFYDSVITDNERRLKFKDENDLEKLDDWILVQGCQKTGIISEIGYRHLDYIRDMRNYASAAHPNHNELTGLDLTNWLQKCITEVLGKEPSGPVIEVRKLLNSLRQETLSKDDVEPIKLAIQNLSDDISQSLLRTIFGMYTDPKTSADIRNNIHLVAKEIWEVCYDEARYDVGLKHDSLSANGEVTRTKLARSFLELVNGLAYLSPNSRAVEINTALEMLWLSHISWNNFYNELPNARNIAALIPENGDTPDSISKKYVKIITMCKIGNGHGTAHDAEEVYDKLINRWQERHIATFISLLTDNDILSRLEKNPCSKNYQTIAEKLAERATINNIKEILNSISNSSINIAKFSQDSRFKQKLRTIGIKS